MAIRQGRRGYRRCDSSPLPTSSRIGKYKISKYATSRPDRHPKRIRRRRSLDDTSSRPMKLEYGPSDRYPHTDSEVALDFQSVSDSADNRPATGDSFLTSNTNSCPSPAISFDATGDSDSDEDNPCDDVELGSKRLAFLFTTLAPSADLVNIWRFPYIVYRHGGIIFAPFVLVFLVLGLPFYYLELILGQAILKKKCCGEKTIGRIIPILKGMTISSAILLSITCIYYMTVISFALVYLFVSLQESLPWSPCSNSSSLFGCLSANHTNLHSKCLEQDPLLCNSTVPHNSWQDYLSLDAITSHHASNDNSTKVAVTHKQLSPLLAFESISVKQVLAIFTAWVFVYMNVMKGKVQFRKTAVLPSLLLLIFLFILLGKATGQHGFQNGVRLYFDFRIAPLSNPELWSDVVTQVVLSLGIGTGAVHRLGQRSPPTCSLLQDAMAVAVTNIGVAFISGVVTFACLGSLAASTGSVSLDILNSDIEASFVGLPAVLATLPVAVVCASLFFSVLVLLSLRRQKLFILALAATLPNSFFTSRKRTRLTMLAICGLLFACGIVFTTKAQFHLLTIIDAYVIGYVALLICFLESTLVIWMYGAKRFMKAFEDSQRTPLHISWKLTWMACVPFLSLVLLVVMLLRHQMPFEEEKHQDQKSGIIGWFLLGVTILPVPAYSILCVVKTLCNGNDRKQSLKRICHPCFGEDCSLVRTRKCNLHYNSSGATHMLVIRIADDSIDSGVPSIPYGFIIQHKKKTSRMNKFSTSSLLPWGKNSPNRDSCSKLLSASATPEESSMRTVPSGVYWDRDYDKNKESNHWKRAFPILTRSKSMPLSSSGNDMNGLVSASSSLGKEHSVVKAYEENVEEEVFEDVDLPTAASFDNRIKEKGSRSSTTTPDHERQRGKERSKSFDNPAYETEARQPT